MPVVRRPCGDFFRGRGEKSWLIPFPVIYSNFFAYDMSFLCIQLLRSRKSRSESNSKRFDYEDNCLFFHQVIARIFDAPTLKIQAMLKQHLVIELHSRGEHRAAAWYQDTWTGDH